MHLAVQGGYLVTLPEADIPPAKKNSAQKGKGRLPTSMFLSSFKEVSGKVIRAVALTPYTGDGRPTLKRRSLSWAYKPYCWVDDPPPYSMENNGSSNPKTYTCYLLYQNSCILEDAPNLMKLIKESKHQTNLRPQLLWLSLTSPKLQNDIMTSRMDAYYLVDHARTCK